MALPTGPVQRRSAKLVDRVGIEAEVAFDDVLVDEEEVMADNDEDDEDENEEDDDNEEENEEE